MACGSDEQRAEVGIRGGCRCDLQQELLGGIATERIEAQHHPATAGSDGGLVRGRQAHPRREGAVLGKDGLAAGCATHQWCSETDRKSTRLNSSHVKISYAVFC